MKKRSKRLRDISGGSRSVIGMVLALGVLVAVASVPVPAVVVSFPGPELEVAIRDAIGKPIGDIHDIDLIGLAFFDAEDRNIVSPEGQITLAGSVIVRTMGRSS